MVYLKKYIQFINEGMEHNYNEELKSLPKIFNKIGLLIDITSSSSRYLGEEEDNENYTDVKMHWYLKTKDPEYTSSKKPLRIFSDFISDGVTYPMFYNNDLNEALFDDNITDVNICIGTISEEKSNLPNEFFKMIDYRDRTQIKKNVLILLKWFWEQTNGKFKSKFDEKIIDAPYVKYLIISYIDCVIKNDKEPTYEELASMIIESLVHSIDAYQIIQEFKKRDTCMYLTMKCVNPGIENSDDLADMGF